MLLIDIVILGYLVVRALMPAPLRLPLPHWQALTGICGLNVLLMLLALLVTLPGVSATWGAYTGLAATLAAVAGSISLRTTPEAQASRPHPSAPVAPPRGIFVAAPLSPPSAAPICTNCRTPGVIGEQFCATCGTRLPV
jgi:hypothetical protein